jgi:hypothetical protein
MRNSRENNARSCVKSRTPVGSSSLMRLSLILLNENIQHFRMVQKLEKILDPKFEWPLRSSIPHRLSLLVTIRYEKPKQNCSFILEESKSKCTASKRQADRARNSLQSTPK